LGYAVRRAPLNANDERKKTGGAGQDVGVGDDGPEAELQEQQDQLGPAPARGRGTVGVWRGGRPRSTTGSRERTAVAACCPLSCRDYTTFPREVVIQQPEGRAAPEAKCLTE